MNDNLQEADATGTLELMGETAPVSYKVSAGGDQQHGKFVVKVAVKAPRDWLLKRGFKTSATLVRQDGSRLDLHHDGELDVGEAVSVELLAVDDSSSADSDALRRNYPELRL